jgi:hypothetical protein
MSDDFSSSNPFRRKTPIAADLDHNVPHQPQQVYPTISSLHTTNPVPSEELKLQTKIAKKVRVQSPPPSSPEEVSIPQKPPTPIPRDEPPSIDDPFDSSNSDTSDISDDGTTTVKSSYVPSNPFQKTLATLEHTEEAQAHPNPTSTKSSQAAGRASLDVDAFKRLLMTGSTGVATASHGTPATPANTAYGVSSPPRAQAAHLALNDGTSTDTSSISRQSIFEPIQELHSESPRTSHEVSDPDDGRGNAEILTTKPEKKKPPPPSSRHGKLIKVELRDESGTIEPEPNPHLGGRIAQQPLGSSISFQSHPSLTDLNKPLPAAPRSSHDSDRESIFDVESAGKRPEPPSPTSSLRRKTPPAPPISRRHSQLLTGSKVDLNAISTGRLSPNFEEGLSSSDSIVPPHAKAPPPPPSRRPASIRNSSYGMPVSIPGISSPENDRPAKSSAPGPPPARMASTRKSGRPPSTSNMDISNKRLSTAPPPPPPRQRASSRTSLDPPTLSPSPRRGSEDSYGQSLEERRRGSQVSQTTEPAEVSNAPAIEPSNILADLEALQREVDALRGKHEKGNER